MSYRNRIVIALLSVAAVFSGRALSAERIYEAAVQAYLPSGMVDERLQREMIASAAQRIKPAQPVPAERVFDFSFARAASAALR